MMWRAITNLMTFWAEIRTHRPPVRVHSDVKIDGAFSPSIDWVKACVSPGAMNRGAMDLDYLTKLRTTLSN